MNSKVIFGIIVMLMITLGTEIMILPSYASASSLERQLELAKEKAAPTVISGNNVYIVWFTNEGTVNSNYEGFRASNDSGVTFGPINNISNTDNSDSINAEISAEGGNIIVSYWEKNQTSMLPYARVSTDNG